jgi:photosystem II stability/assembly factor-like uncharacterized protein
MFDTNFDKIKIHMILWLVIVMTAVCCEQEEVMENPWNVIIDTKVKQPVRMAAFLNESFGITGGFSGKGKTHRTLDGAESWTKSEPSGGCLYGVEIINDKSVWVAGRMSGMSFTTPGGLRLSKDGGETFEPSAKIPIFPEECPMSFLDQNNGLFFQRGRLRSTNDGGQTWKEISLPEDADIIKAVHMRTINNGYLLDLSGNFFMTNDGGNTWNKTQLPLHKYHGLGLTEFESSSASIRFFDDNKGIVVTSLSGGEHKDRVQAFRTTDGGRNWKSELVTYGGGSIFLSPDAQYVTVQLDGNILVLQYTGEE